MVIDSSQITSVIEAANYKRYYNGIKKESVVESHNFRRFWSWKDIINESVCKQKILKPIQGDDWSRFSY